jgi:hypothetical protein
VHLEERKLFSSLDLPGNPQDYVGQTFYCCERGVNPGYFTPWDSCGGQWTPRGPSYTGTVANLPAAANVRIGTRAVIDELAPGGLTRPPAAGTKMRRLKLICGVQPDGVTPVWLPDGKQVLFQLGGTTSGPSIADWTAPAGTSIIGEVGLIPANLLANANSKLWWDAQVGRHTTATATADAILALGTSGTAGTALSDVTTLAASVSVIGWLLGSMWVKTATAEDCTITNTPQGKANVAAQATLAIDLTALQTLQFAVANAANLDIFNVRSLTIGVC